MKFAHRRAVKNPPHPGEVIRHRILESVGLTVTEAAKALDVTRLAHSIVVNGRASLTLETGSRIEKTFDPKMDHFMRMQFGYDLALTRARSSDIAAERCETAK